MLVIFFMILTAVLQVGALYLLQGWLMMLALWGLPYVVALVFTVIKPPDHYFTNMYALYLWCALFMGPFATLGSLISFVLLPFSQQKSIQQFRKRMFEAGQLSNYDRVRFNLVENPWDDDDIQLETMVDIMQSGDRQLKQNAIDKVIQQPSRVSVKVLKTGLKDPDSDIRYYAAGGLIQLNDMFQKQFDHLATQLRTQPRNPELWQESAIAYDQFYFWGMTSEDNVEIILERAVNGYRQSLQLNPDQEMVYSHLGRIYLKRENYPEALKALEEGLKRYPTSINLLGWLAETYYATHRYQDLAELAWRCTVELKLPEKLVASMNYWAFGDAVEATQPPV